MKLLAMSVLLAILQTVSPASPNAADTHAGTIQTVKIHADTKQSSTTNATSISDAVTPIKSTHADDRVMSSDTQQNVKIIEPLSVSVKPGCTGWLSVIFAGLLVVVGFGGVYYANKTVKATEVAAKAARDSADAALRNLEIFIDKDRARLSVEPTNRNGIDSVTDNNPILFFDLVITHEGPTNATDVRGAYMLIVTDSDAAPPMQEMWRMNSNFGTILNNVIKPTDPPLHAKCSIHPFTVEDRIAVEDGTQFLHFYGYLFYSDIFDTRHTIPFRYIWRSAGQTIYGQSYEATGWQKHGPDSDNIPTQQRRQKTN